METIIKVDGMHCEHCAKRVKKAAEAAANVSSAVVSLEDKNCVVTHDNADINGIINAINELGFTASL
jgi:copper chaperone CopZ